MGEPTIPITRAQMLELALQAAEIVARSISVEKNNTITAQALEIERLKRWLTVIAGRRGSAGWCRGMAAKAIAGEPVPDWMD